MNDKLVFILICLIYPIVQAAKEGNLKKEKLKGKLIYLLVY
jgi:hypothetical protein